MVAVKQHGELVLINTKMITYTASKEDSRVSKPYKLVIQFTGGTELVLSFSIEKEREDFIDEIIYDSNGSK